MSSRDQNHKEMQQNVITIAQNCELYIVYKEARSISRWVCVKIIQENKHRKKVKTARLLIFSTLIQR